MAEISGRADLVRQFRSVIGEKPGIVTQEQARRLRPVIEQLIALGPSDPLHDEWVSYRETLMKYPSIKWLK